MSPRRRDAWARLVAAMERYANAPSEDDAEYARRAEELKRAASEWAREREDKD